MSRCDVDAIVEMTRKLIKLEDENAWLKESHQSEQDKRKARAVEEMTHVKTLGQLQTDIRSAKSELEKLQWCTSEERETLRAIRAQYDAEFQQLVTLREEASSSNDEPATQEKPG